MATQTSAVPKVFISYSHKDREWLDRLKVHLKPLERRYKSSFDIWDDTKIKPGDLWAEEISKALNASKAAILLVSANFMASDFITSEEMPALLKSAKESGTDILIVNVGPSLFSTVEGLSRFQTVNDPQTPLMGLEEVKQEQVFLTVATLVELSLRREASPPPAPLAADSPATNAPAADATTDAAPPASDCRDYATIFDIHIRRERRTIPLAYIAVLVTSLVGVALLLTTWLMIEMKEKPGIVGGAFVFSLAAFGFSYVLLNKVRDRYAAIESCEFMKKKFDACETWDATKLREHIVLALEFLKRGMREA